MKAIDLPENELSQARSTIWELLRQPDDLEAKNCYTELLKTISKPMAVAQGRLVRGTRSLQYLLNGILLFHRAKVALYILFLVLSFTNSPWFLIGIACVSLTSRVAHNLQTRINVELAARLMVLDQRLEEHLE